MIPQIVFIFSESDVTDEDRCVDISAGNVKPVQNSLQNLLLPRVLMSFYRGNVSSFAIESYRCADRG